MAQKTIEDIKLLFQDGDMPSGQDFTDLVDTLNNLYDSGTPSNPRLTVTQNATDIASQSIVIDNNTTIIGSHSTSINNNTTIIGSHSTSISTLESNSMVKVSVDIPEATFQLITDSNPIVIGSGLSGSSTILHSASIYPYNGGFDNSGGVPIQLDITRNTNTPFVGSLKRVVLDPNISYSVENNATQFNDIDTPDLQIVDLVHDSTVDSFYLFSNGGGFDWQGDWRIVLFYSVI